MCKASMGSVKEELQFDGQGNSFHDFMADVILPFFAELSDCCMSGHYNFPSKDTDLN